MITLSTDQQVVVDALMSWQKKPSTPYVTVGGYAGTGKTTVTALLRQLLNKQNKKLRVAFCSYTGKATMVLMQKLREQMALMPQDSVSTIHSLIYSPVVNSNDEIVGWERKEELDCDLIIVDEASMIDQQIWSDLQSFQIPIIAVGDHGQLPPIRGSFSLMNEPHLRLEQIHRQIEDNPIIKLSRLAREGRKIPIKDFSSGVVKVSRRQDGIFEQVGDLLMGEVGDTLMLCGYNSTRVKLNQYARQQFELHTPLPEPGDRVICLRNNHTQGIYNGMTGIIENITSEDEEWFYAEIDMGEGEPEFKGLILKEQFNNPQSLNHTDGRRRTLKGDLFDFGYAVTVHKAQGSQAKNVILFEERFKSMDDNMWSRWLYTGITRAQENLLIIGD